MLKLWGLSSSSQTRYSPGQSEGEILHSTRCCTGCAPLRSSNTAAVLRRRILGNGGGGGQHLGATPELCAPGSRCTALGSAPSELQRPRKQPYIQNTAVCSFQCHLPSLQAAPEEKQGSYGPQGLFFPKNSPRHAPLPNWTGDPRHVLACIHQAATLLENTCRQDRAWSLL